MANNSKQAKRSLLLFPFPKVEIKNKLTGSPPKTIHYPKKADQWKRILPKIKDIQEKFTFQTTPIGIDPELALVFETVEPVDGFQTAVNGIKGLEWIRESDGEPIEPDENFYEEKDETCSLKPLRSKIYCVVSDKSAFESILTQWKRYVLDKDYQFPRGFTGLKKVFDQLENLRVWNAQDRMEETGITEYWKEQIEYYSSDTPTEQKSDLVPFEIELFYRSREQKRKEASDQIEFVLNRLKGSVLKECLIPEIAYHGFLVNLPKDSISDFLKDFKKGNYQGIQIAKIEGVMYIRPMSQFSNNTKVEPLVSLPHKRKKKIPEKIH